MPDELRDKSMEINDSELSDNELENINGGYGSYKVFDPFKRTFIEKVTDGTESEESEISKLEARSVIR